MGGDTSKLGGGTGPPVTAGEDSGDNTGLARRYPPISTRSLSVPTRGSGLGDDEVLEDPVRKVTLQRHRSSLVVVNRGQDPASTGVSRDPLMKKLEELHFFYPLMHDVEKRSGLFGTHNKRALHEIQSKVPSLPALKIVRMYEGRLKEHAETVSNTQAQLSSQIKEIDQSVSSMLKNYSERTKVTARYVDRLTKMEDLKKNLSKCHATFDECIAIINLLNEMLPETEKIEEFDPWVDEHGSECVDNT